MKSLQVSIAFLSLLLVLAVPVAPGQQKGAAATNATGGIKGKVRSESGGGVSGVLVIARQGEREVARTESGSKGEFVLAGLAPGRYGFTFRKPGLSTGTLEDVEIRAGKVRELADRLVLKVDEGTLAFLRGSVFNQDGRSVPGARVELARVLSDGSAKKLDGRLTNETGSFVFRLPPDTATYRVTVKAENAEPVSKNVEIDGPAVYRVALSVQSSPK
jgi:hypothetical protein